MIVFKIIAIIVLIISGMLIERGIVQKDISDIIVAALTALMALPVLIREDK